MPIIARFLDEFECVKIPRLRARWAWCSSTRRNAIIRVWRQAEADRLGARPVGVSSEGWPCSAGERPAGRKSQKPRSLDSRVAGNQDSEAYRQRLLVEDDESPGRNDSERQMWPLRKCVAPKAESSTGGRRLAWGSRNLTDAAPSLRRGGSDSTVARTCRATGEALLVPARTRRSKGRSYNRLNQEVRSKAKRVTDGFAVAVRGGVTPVERRSPAVCRSLRPQGKARTR